jgi:hypothetical protein
MIRVLIFIAAFFAIASFFLRELDTDDLPRWVAAVADIIVGLFDVNAERSMPTWYSSLLLAACALLVGSISYFKWQHHEIYQRRWSLLALLFAAASLDEIAGLHEQLNEPLKRLLEPPSWFHFTWVIAGTLVVSVVAVFYFRFWLHFARPVRYQLLIATLFFIGGAIGFEMIGAHEYSRHGSTSLYTLITSFEEFGEMLGATLFLNTFWSYLAAITPTLSIRL